jgi:hypothetical protein
VTAFNLPPGCTLQAIEEQAGDLYLLQNLHAGYVGNSPMFWRKGSCGYTAWIDDAKRFTAEECDEIERGSQGSHKWQRWPADLIERLARRTVDMQDLRKETPC